MKKSNHSLIKASVSAESLPSTLPYAWKRQVPLYFLNHQLCSFNKISKHRLEGWDSNKTQ